MITNIVNSDCSVPSHNWAEVAAMGTTRV